MNSVSRGVRNAFRNMIRTGSIVLILALSIGLIIAMLAARQAVSDKISAVKSSVGNTITIAPAGVRGFEGGGTPLTTDQLSKVVATAHVTGVTSTLSDRMTTEQTNLVSSIEPGSFGNRQSGTTGIEAGPPPSVPSIVGTTQTTTRTFTPPVIITGVNNVSNASTFGGNTLAWKSGHVFDATKDVNEAVLGTSIATKNNLSVGSTFTAYDMTMTVVGIYDAGNTFANNGIFVSLTTLQRLSSQAGAVTSASATVDSSDNLAAATTAIKSALGTAADVTNSQDTADQLVAPLESVKQISMFSLIGALVAGAVIILLTMMMIVRERRREIGVMKAIGSSNSGIMWQFVVEATTLTVLALVVGLGIGVAAATPLTNSLVSTSSSSTSSQTTGMRPMGPRGFGQASQQALTNIQASVGASMLVYGALAAIAIAIVGSAVPSFIISKIKPAEAMRSE
ncbi:MAG: FtsX-like permease family protein [Candidatus Saccharimonadales bacterium]|jgi:putative ABC transport system permease protein